MKTSTYTLITLTVLALFLIAAISGKFGQEEPGTPTKAISKPNSAKQDELTAMVPEMLTEMDEATTPAEKWATAWAFAKATVEANGDTSAVIDYGGDNDVHLELILAETPYEWSRVVGWRLASEQNDPNTLRIHVATFANSLPWKPTKDATQVWVNTESNQGETDTLGWIRNDHSTAGQQRIEIQFRLLED